MRSNKAVGKSTAAKSRSKESSFKTSSQSSPRRKSSALQAGGVILSLAGVLACNYFGLGFGRAVCHGLLVAALGAPFRGASSRRARA